MVLLSDDAKFYEHNESAVFTLNQTAKLLNIDMGRTALMQFLRDEKLILRDNSPSQEMLERGLMVYKIKVIKRGKAARAKPTPVTLITIVGLAYLQELLANKYDKIKGAPSTEIIIHSGEMIARSLLVSHPDMTEQELFDAVMERIEPLLDSIRNGIKKSIFDVCLENNSPENSVENENEL